MVEKTLVIYHRVDYDGIFSGCTVKKFLIDSGVDKNPTMLGWNYGDQIPDILNQGYTLIFMVDISFPPAFMKDLKAWTGGKVVWIDHHITAIDGSEAEGYSDMEGLRRIGTAACELCWEYLYDQPAPMIIQRLSAYDVWDRTRFNWEDEVLPLQAALKVTYGIGEKYIWPNFNNLVQMGEKGINILLGTGKLLNKYDAMRFKSEVGRFAFPIVVGGHYKGIAILGTSFTSLVFQSVFPDYEVYCVFNRKNGRKDDGEVEEVYSLSLYSEPNRIDLNLGEYLKSKYGDAAGGHASAAGAQIPFEDFMKLLIDKTI